MTVPRDVVFSVPEDKVAMIKALANTPTAFKIRLWGDSDQSIPPEFARLRRQRTR